MKSKKRWRLIANWKIQGGLILRLFAYWVLFQVAYSATTAVFTFVNNGTVPSELVSPGLVVSFLVLPVCMLDLICFSNRFVGPVKNLSRGLRELADGDQTTFVNLRPGDFYSELSSDFDRIKDRINGSEKRAEAKPALLKSQQPEVTHA